MGIQKDARAPTQRQLPLPDPIEEQRAAYRAEIVASAGKHRADVEAMLKLRGSALYDRLYRFLLKLKLESYKPEDAYRMRTSPELGVLLRVLAEGTQNAPEDVMSAALLSLCERRSGEDIWDLNALRASIAAVGDDIAELKNAINSIMETVAVTCYINPAGGIKTEEDSKDVAIELEKIKLQEKEPQPYEANTEE